MPTEEQVQSVKGWIFRAMRVWYFNTIIRDALLILSLYGFLEIFEGEYGLVQYLGALGLCVIGFAALLFLLGCSFLLVAFSQGAKAGLTESDIERIVTEVAKAGKKGNGK